MKETKVGIVTSPKVPLPPSSWKYEMKRYLINDLGMNSWRNGSRTDTHKLSLYDLAQITSNTTAKKEIEMKDEDNEIKKRILTWEGGKVIYDKIDKYVSIKLNLVRVDPLTKMVIGSRRQKLQQKRIQKKKKNKKKKLSKNNKNNKQIIIMLMTNELATLNLFNHHGFQTIEPILNQSVFRLNLHLIHMKI